MTEIAREIRVALRAMTRDRSFALPVLLTLTVSIAANAAVFAVVSSVILRPLPLPDADRLVWIANSYPGAGVPEAANGVPDYYDRRGLDAFSDLAIFTSTGRTVGTRDGAERLTAMVTTPSLFRVLGTSPEQGRLLAESDGEPGQEHQVVLGYGLWQRLYAGREDAIGRELRINGTAHTVVGVLPRDFVFVDPEVSLWLPLAFTPEDRADDRRHSNSYEMVARLAPGATVEQAQQQLDALNRANLERFPASRQVLIDAGFTTRAQPLRDRLVRDVRGTLYLLWGGVLFVLLIGCVNVTNLALVRATGREREMAARQSLGAGRGRLLRQLLVESLLLTSAAAVAGTLLAAVTVRLLVANAGARIPRGTEIALGAPTLLLAAGLAFALGLLLALVPLVSGRQSLAQTLRQESRSGTAGRRVIAVRRALVAAQVAFAFVLLLGAGLLLASFQKLLAVRPGFDTGGVLTGKVSLPAASYPEDPQLAAWTERTLERVRALPGVSAAAFGNTTPFAGNYSDSVILAETYQAPPGESLLSPAENVVTAGYFAALGIPVLAGRPIDERDTADSQPVVVVDQRLAEKFWRGRDPLGQRMYQVDSAEDIGRPGPDTRLLTVVGVVAEVKQRGLASPEERLGAYYFAYPQQPRRNLTLVARIDGDPLLVANAVRSEIAALDPELPLYDVQTMAARVEGSVAGRRAAVALASGFGFVALLLATLGIYGALAYQVTQRRREIGIRMALGSATGSVFRLVLREGAAVLTVGLGLGFAGLFALRRLLAAELYGVAAHDPGVLGVVTLLLAVVGLTACALPARRAARIDPVVALAD